MINYGQLYALTAVTPQYKHIWLWRCRRRFPGAGAKAGGVAAMDRAALGSRVKRLHRPHLYVKPVWHRAAAGASPAVCRTKTQFSLSIWGLLMVLEFQQGGRRGLLAPRWSHSLTPWLPPFPGSAPLPHICYFYPAPHPCFPYRLSLSVF